MYTRTIEEENVKKRLTILIQYGKAVLLAYDRREITQSQMDDFANKEVLAVVVSAEGMSAFRKKVFKMKEIKDFRHPKLLTSLLSEYGQLALKEQLITFKQANRFVNPDVLEILMSQEGYHALKSGRILIDAVKAVKSADLFKFILQDEKGIDAFKSGDIKLDELDNFNSRDALMDVVRGRMLKRSMNFNYFSNKKLMEKKSSALGEDICVDEDDFVLVDSPKLGGGGLR